MMMLMSECGPKVMAGIEMGTVSWQDGSVGRCTCCQAQGPEFDSWNPYSMKEGSDSLRLSADFHMQTVA